MNSVPYALRRSLRVRRITLMAVAGLLVVGTGLVVATQPLWAFDLLAWAMPRILWRVETKEALVALSFDDGPAPDHMPQVLEILSRHGAHATFFLIGDRIRPSHRRLAEERGYRIVLGSAYPYDGSRSPSAYIQWLVTKNLEPGVIVILHDGIADPSRMMRVLDSILSAGERKGVRFVTVGALLRASDARPVVN